MSVDVVELFQVELTPADLEVGRAKHTHVQRFPTVDENPLSKVEFATTLHTKGPLDILLNNLLLGFLGVAQYVLQLACAVDTVTARVVRWLHNPNVMSPINLSVLLKQLLQRQVETHDFELFVACEAFGRHPPFDEVVLELHHAQDLAFGELHLRSSTVFPYFLGLLKL